MVHFTAFAIASLALLIAAGSAEAANWGSSPALRNLKASKSSKGMKGPQPVIYDTDYGPFIDDVFALGLLANSADLLDLQYVIATGENPTLGAQCAAKHLGLADFGDIPVGIGAEFPKYSLRGGVCAQPGLLGFALEERCSEGPDVPVDDDGIAAIASLVGSSDRDDWWYITVGGQSTLKKLFEDYPEAGDKFSTLIVMGGNWCTGFQPYPDVNAPTDETNIACDPAAANALVDSNFSPFDKIYYVPVVVADEIGGEDYIKIVEAANSGADLGAAATLDFYKAWSAAGRADEDLLIHLEALTYDPETESTPQFDACAVMLALELLDDESCENRLSFFDFDAVHFLESTDDGLQPFPEAPRSSFSLVPENLQIDVLPDQCPALTEFSFDPADTPEEDMPVTVALGFTSPKAKDSFYAEMAERMAGTFGGTTKSPKCFNKTPKGKAPKASKASKKSKSLKATKSPEMA